MLNQEALEILFVDLLDSLSTYIGYASGEMKFEYLKSHHEHYVSRELDLLEVGILNLMNALEEEFDNDESGESKITERQRLFKLIKEYCYVEVMGNIFLDPMWSIFNPSAMEDFNIDGFLEDIQKIIEEMENPEAISDALDFFDKVEIAYTFRDIGVGVKEIVEFRVKLANDWFKKGDELLAKDIIEKILSNTIKLERLDEEYLFDMIDKEAKRLIEKSDPFSQKIQEWISN